VTCQAGVPISNSDYTSQISGSIQDNGSTSTTTSFLITTRISNSPQTLGPSIKGVAIPSISIGTSGTASFATTVTIHNETARIIMGSGVNYDMKFPVTNNNLDVSRTWTSALISTNPAINSNYVYLKQTFTPPKSISK
jgi:hypothetical protein